MSMPTGPWLYRLGMRGKHNRSPDRWVWLVFAFVEKCLLSIERVQGGLGDPSALPLSVMKGGKGGPHLRPSGQSANPPKQ